MALLTNASASGERDAVGPALPSPSRTLRSELIHGDRGAHGGEELSVARPNHGVVLEPVDLLHRHIDEDLVRGDGGPSGREQEILKRDGS